MSIPEAAQLVLQAGLMGEGGEIFVLDMGEPVKIAELARLMIRLSGADEDRIRIEYTGLRPGEKLYEELLADDESTLPTPHPKLRVAKARAAGAAWHDECVAWLADAEPKQEEVVKSQMKRWVPEYQPGFKSL
jgi:FlaA1/EpsC-like NDP-sugar epimerase